MTPAAQRLRAMADLAVESAVHDPAVQLANVTAALQRRRMWRVAALAGGVAAAVAAAVLLLVPRGAYVETPAAADGFMAPAWSEGSKSSAPARHPAGQAASARPPTGEQATAVAMDVEPEDDPLGGDAPDASRAPPEGGGAQPGTAGPDAGSSAPPRSKARRSTRTKPPEPPAAEALPDADLPEATHRARASPSELLGAARAARAARDADSAREALLEVRTRFPDHPAAGQATFLLGRIEGELAADSRAAATWFGRYVREFPKGQFVGQARGRVMVALDRRGDRRAAHVAAREYLDHHADGPYAARARDIVAASDATPSH